MPATTDMRDPTCMNCGRFLQVGCYCKWCSDYRDRIAELEEQRNAMLEAQEELRERLRVTYDAWEAKCKECYSLEGTLIKRVGLVKALLAVCEDALAWLESAPIEYRNGVTGPTGTLDEGNIRGLEGHCKITEHLEAAIKLARGGDDG